MTHLFALLQITDDPDPAVFAVDALQRFSFKLFYRLLIDLVAIYALIRIVYFKIYKKRDLFFTFFIFNIIIFLLCYLLNKVELSMGAAFGLFAVFSMLRYRTEDVSVKDMSYLFLGIAMGLINAVTKIKQVPGEYELIFLIVLNSVIVGLAYLLEGKLLFRRESVQLINYDNLELIQPGARMLLMEDIKKRTGIPVHKVSINKIDLTKPSVQLKVYYYED